MLVQLIYVSKRRPVDKHTLDDLAQDCSISIANALEILQSCTKPSIDGLAQDCSISIANALEILQSCTKPSQYILPYSLVTSPLSTRGKLINNSLAYDTAILQNHTLYAPTNNCHRLLASVWQTALALNIWVQANHLICSIMFQVEQKNVEAPNFTIK